MVVFIGVALFMMTFHSSGHDKINVVSTFNMFTTLHNSVVFIFMNERIFVREKPHECV